MTDLSVSEVEAMLAKLTAQGVWHPYDRGIGWEAHREATCVPECLELNMQDKETFKQADAEFIAAAPQIAKQYLEVVKENSDLRLGGPCTYKTVIESMEMLEAAGMGTEGKPNTLWAMTQEAIEQLAALRKERDRLVSTLEGRAEEEMKMLAEVAAENDELRAELERLKGEK